MNILKGHLFNFRRTQRARGLNSHDGFSLTELLIVAATIGIIAAFAIPNVSRTLALRRLETGTSMIASKLAEARSNAIKRNTSARLVIDSSAHTVQVQVGTSPVGVATQLPQGVSFSGTPPTQIVFDSLGRASAASTLTLTGAQTGGSSKSIAVSAFGKVSVNNMTSTP
ncbi:MAG: GspH/FimT family pseudopilin [Pyrinomonadaceae bacterium]